MTSHPTASRIAASWAFALLTAGIAGCNGKPPALPDAPPPVYESPRPYDPGKNIDTLPGAPAPTPMAPAPNAEPSADPKPPEAQPAEPTPAEPAPTEPAPTAPAPSNP